MAIEFISAQVMHARLRPTANRFRYRVPYLAIPIAELEAKARRGVLSIDGFNLFSVLTKDYGCEGAPAAACVRQILARFGVAEADGDIVLVTIPRVLGFAFNPVSFWLCFDKGSALRAVIAEVNNTFGERHFYLCCNQDHRPISTGDTLTAAKVFHVSPFMKVEGEYRFTFVWEPKTFAVRIDLYDAAGLILRTSLAGPRQRAANARLLSAFFANPLLMFKVLALIHLQAARLLLKGLTPLNKPSPPPESVTR